MEFSYGEYNVTFVQNATDCILRFEDKKTLKLYENTFFERDFAEFSPFGGLDFVCNLIQEALGKANEKVAVKKCAFVSKNLVLTIEYSSSVFPKPLEVILNLAPKRRESATEDMETMGRRLKDMEKMIQSLRCLKERIEMLEDMNDGMVMIPGCYPVPQDVKHLNLLLFGSQVPEGIPNIGNVLAYNGLTLFVTMQSGQWGRGALSDTQPLLNSLSNVHYNHVTNASLTTLKNLKYLQSCETLILSGMSLITDYSPIGQMKNLKTLAIVGSPNNQFTPQLEDIAWIKDLLQLKNVYFTHCQHLVNIRPLQSLENLKVLNIQGTGVKNSEFLRQSTLTIKK